MNNRELQVLYHSLDEYELDILRQSKRNVEENKQIKFINLQAYLDYLAMAVIKRQNRGEFVPHNIQEAQAGQYL